MEKEQTQEEMKKARYQAVLNSHKDEQAENKEQVKEDGTSN
jgi:hypothetical protein